MGATTFRLLVLFALFGAGVLALSNADGPRTALGAGCGPARTHAFGSTNETISTADGLRSYRVHIPPSYTGVVRTPLILNFHGFISNGTAQESYSGLATRSDQPDGGFILVSPEGLPNGSGQQWWNTVQLSSPTQDDVAFVNALLDKLESTLCIDSARVFATGLSNGAMMSVRLACSLSSRIAAVAPVAGAYYPQLSLTDPPGPFHNSAEVCEDARPVPIIAFHGTADTYVLYNGGTGGTLGGDWRLPIDNNTADEDVMEDWSGHNGCTSGRQETTLTSEVRLIEYTACDEGADVVHYAVDGGGHTWPGAPDAPFLGYTTHDISANDLMWAFFQAHPNPDAPPSDIDGDGIPDSLDSDADGDGCPNAAEQGPDPTAGGERDPKNPWDYFNPTLDGLNRTDDVSAEVLRYGHDAGDPMYDTRYDRSTFPGGAMWQFGPPDGIIRTLDISAAVRSYGHDCS